MLLEKRIPSVVLTVQRSGGSSGSAAVSWATTDSTAVAGDYTAGSGTLTWTDGDVVDKQIIIAISDDSEVEAVESFSVTLSDATGASLGSPAAASVTINSDDTAPVGVSLLAQTAIVYEGQELTVTMELDPASSVALNGSLILDGDILSADFGSLDFIIPANVTSYQVVIEVSDDSISEGIKTATIDLNISSSEGFVAEGSEQVAVELRDDDPQLSALQWYAPQYPSGLPVMNIGQPIELVVGGDPAI